MIYEAAVVFLFGQAVIVTGAIAIVLAIFEGDFAKENRRDNDD